MQRIALLLAIVLSGMLIQAQVTVKYSATKYGARNNTLTFYTDAVTFKFEDGTNATFDRGDKEIMKLEDGNTAVIETLIGNNGGVYLIWVIGKDAIVIKNNDEMFTLYLNKPLITTKTTKSL